MCTCAKAVRQIITGECKQAGEEKREGIESIDPAHVWSSPTFVIAPVVAY